MSGAMEDAVVAVVAGCPRPVEVVGDGPLAGALRQRLDTAMPIDAPATIVETTGDADQLRQALQRVRDLGTIVLVGPEPTDAVTLDVYADLHVRGLTLVGVPSPPA